jgi:thiaminase/transcriptional activator TenA
MRRYLIQDHRFVDTFVVLLASMIARAPTLKDRIPGCQFLGLVTGKENNYFERSLAALGIDGEASKAAPMESATQVHS